MVKISLVFIVYLNVYVHARMHTDLHDTYIYIQSEVSLPYLGIFLSFSVLLLAVELYIDSRQV